MLGRNHGLGHAQGAELAAWRPDLTARREAFGIIMRRCKQINQAQIAA